MLICVKVQSCFGVNETKKRTHLQGSVSFELDNFLMAGFSEIRLIRNEGSSEGFVLNGRLDEGDSKR
jgi:hypothetical protein